MASSNVFGSDFVGISQQMGVPSQKEGKFWDKPRISRFQQTSPVHNVISCELSKILTSDFLHTGGRSNRNQAVSLPSLLGGGGEGSQTVRNPDSQKPGQSETKPQIIRNQTIGNLDKWKPRQSEIRTVGDLESQKLSQPHWQSEIQTARLPSFPRGGRAQPGQSGNPDKYVASSRKQSQRKRLIITTHPKT